MSNQQTSQEQLSAIPTPLTLGDKINWPFLLGNALLKVQEAIVKVEGEQSEQEVRESVLFLYNILPESWQKDDAQFKKDLKKAMMQREIDIRREWCGRKVGSPKFGKEDYVEPWRLLHACVDVLDRKGLISKKNIQERSDGNQFDLKKLEEIIKP